MHRPTNLERNVKNASAISNQIVNRSVVLMWLGEDVEYLRKKARCKNPIKNPVRVKLLRASIYGCSTILHALRDKEIEDLAAEIQTIKEHLGMKET